MEDGEFRISNEEFRIKNHIHPTRTHSSFLIRTSKFEISFGPAWSRRCCLSFRGKNDVPNAHISNLGILQIEVLRVNKEVVRFLGGLFLRVNRPTHRACENEEIQLTRFVEVKRVH